ncbi:MAG TPA: OsmC family protein [Micropepsaceae bacterium]|nr:OsmC family protein [Micropepsaceae bacterium]
MAEIRRSSSAVWNGSGKEGKGTISSASGTLKDVPYSFAKRFGEEKGTNPEELIAAAHAGCYSMALAFQLAGAGHPADKLETKAEVTIMQEGGGWKISAVHLTLEGSVPGIAADQFQKLAEAAKAGCPVSKVLNATITLSAKLK